MAIEEPDYPTRIRIEESESPSNAFLSRNRCCFNFPCFGPSAARLGGGGATSTTSNDDRWWAGPLKAIKKLREWSEIVAGPKWKTFIRRFNRNHRNNRHYQAAGGGGGGGGGGKFQYDPLSYALNFDEGPAGQNGQFEEEYGQFPDFSSRFASVPQSAKSSMDLGRGGAPAG